MPLFVRSLEDFTPPKRFDALPFTEASIQESATEDGPWTTLETFAILPIDSDPSDPAERSFTTALATLEEGWYRLLWEDAASSQFLSDAVFFEADFTAFATVSDVESRLGRELTDAETDQIEWVLALVTSLIADAGGIAAADFDPVPAYFKVLCVEKCVVALSNPTGLAAQSETLGAYSYSNTFPRNAGDSIGVFLNDHELRYVRQIANNAVSASVRVPSLAREVYTTAEDT